MSTLRVLLLGPPAVYYDNIPLTIQRRSLRVVLYYLAAQENMIDRAQLIVALWPDESESTGRRRLRELLSKLRAELPDATLLVTNQDQIGLDRSRLYVDALEFTAVFRDCNPISNSVPRHLPLPERAFQQIQSAVNLWRMPVFMSGVQMLESEDLDRWVTESGRMLERRRVLLIDRLSDHFAASGDIESAVSWLSRILEEDPDNEDWQVRYLAWLNQLNRRSEAITYADHLLHYYKDRGEKLPERIKNASFPVRPQSGETESDENPLWPPPAQLQTPFVGRQQEMQQLVSAFQCGGVTLLWGDAGSGKTRLAYEFSKQVAGRSRQLVGSGFSTTKDLPYQPILEMLRQGILEKEWRAMPTAWIIPLLPLMPELHRYVPPASPIDSSSLGDMQGMIFESLHQIFRSLARQARLLIFLDDAHLSDRSTLDVFAFLFSHGFFEHNGLLLVAARSDVKSSSMEKFVQQLHKPTLRSEEFYLPDFSAQDASALMTIMLGRSYPPQAVQQLLEISDGKPLFLVELLRSVLEYSAWTDLEEVIDTLPLPVSIRSMVQGRIGLLSNEARRVLQIAAVSNGNFHPAMLELALGMPSEKVVDALEELEQQRLVSPAGSGPDGVSYKFMHGRIRSIILGDISEARKRLLHLSIAHAMTSLPQENNNPSLIAGHFEAAGDVKNAFDYWALTGNHSRGLFSRADAEYAFQKAASFVQHLGSFVTDEEIYRLYAAWGELLNDAYDFKSGMDLYYTLQALGNQRQSHLLVGTAFNGLCRLFRSIGEYERALQYSKQAEDHLKMVKSTPEHIFLLNRRAITYMYLEDYGHAIKALKKSIKLSAIDRSWRVQAGLSSTFTQMVEISLYKGWLKRTEEICHLGLGSIETTMNNVDIEMIRLKLAQVKCINGNSGEGCKLANQVLKLGNEWNHNRLIGFARLARAQAELYMGLVGESLDDLEESFEIAAQYNFMDLAQRTYSLTGEFYAHLGNLPQAARAYKMSLESTTRQYLRLDNQVRYGCALCQMGQSREGMDVIEESLLEAEAGGYGLILITAYTFLIKEYLSRRDVNQAEDTLQKLAACIEKADAEQWPVMLQHFTTCLHLLKGHEVTEAEVSALVEYARTSASIWQEISAQKLMLAYRHSRGADTTAPRQKLRELEQFLLDHAYKEHIRHNIIDWFANYYRMLPVWIENA
jgi:DNA-binding SARP family transcriptional activator